MTVIARILIAAVIACASPCALAEKLRLVTEPWSPYVMVDGQKASGLDYETVTIVLNRLGIEVQWQFLPWKRCLLMLEQGEADGILDIIQSGDRQNLLLYPSEPLSQVNWAMFQANDRPHAFNSLEDLNGLTIGVSPGYLYTPPFDTSSSFIRAPGPSPEANFGKLLLGRIDLMVTDRVVGQQMLTRLKLQDQVSELARPLGSTELFLALRRNAGMDFLVQRFSAELKRFKREPAYAQLVAHYTGASMPGPTPSAVIESVVGAENR